MRSNPSLRSFPSVASETVPMFVLTDDGYVSSQRRSSSNFRASFFQAIGGVMSLALCPTYSVSSSLTLQTFRGASKGCPPVDLLRHFPSLRHDQCSTPTGVFKGGCRPSTHSSLGFPFHFSPFVASSLNLWGWWHVWSPLETIQRRA